MTEEVYNHVQQLIEKRAGLWRNLAMGDYRRAVLLYQINFDDGFIDHLFSEKPLSEAEVREIFKEDEKYCIQITQIKNLEEIEEKFHNTHPYLTKAVEEMGMDCSIKESFHGK